MISIFCANLLNLQFLHQKGGFLSNFNFMVFYNTLILRLLNLCIVNYRVFYSILLNRHIYDQRELDKLILVMHHNFKNKPSLFKSSFFSI